MTTPPIRPIHDKVAETHLVVSCLKQLDLVPRVVGLVTADMLVDQDCRTVFGIMARRFKAGERFDAYAIATELERSGYCSGPKHSCLLLIEMAEDVVTSAHWKYYCAVIRDLADRRKLQSACLDSIRDLAQGWKPPRDVAVELGEVLFNFERVYCQTPEPTVKLPSRRRRVG